MSRRFLAAAALASMAAAGWLAWLAFLPAPRLRPGYRETHALNLASRLSLPRRRGAQRRIVCLGDSHTFGAGVQAAEAYPSQLEARLNSLGGPRYQVINAGAGGICLLEKRLIYERRCRALRRSLVLLQVGPDLPRIALHILESEGGMGWLWRRAEAWHDRFPGSGLATWFWARVLSHILSATSRRISSPQGRDLLERSQAVFEDNLAHLAREVEEDGSRLVVVEYSPEALKDALEAAVALSGAKAPLCRVEIFPVRDIYLPDGHLNAAGYRIFVDKLLGECGKILTR